MFDNQWINIILIYWLSIWAIFLWWCEKKIQKGEMRKMTFLEAFFSLLFIGVLFPILLLFSLFKKNK